MLLPLPPQSSKPVPKKSQSSKIVPSHHDPSEKTGENCQTKISPSSLQESPSSLQGALKKRSAFEDLTNASQCQPVQPKKEANKEFVKDVSKKINRNTCALGLAKKNKRNLKSHKLEVTPVVASTTVVPNIMEKPLILDISTTSKTPNTEEASLFRKPLVLKEEPTIEDKTLIKKSLSLKKCSNDGEVSLLEKLQPLQEESDSDDEFVIEPMTFKKTHKTEEAAITKKTLSLKKKMCASQGKQSCQKESLAVQDVNIEEDSFFMESMSFKKKPKTEESIPTHKLSSLKKKCTIYGKICHFKKPPVLQTTISGAMSSIKKPLSFKKKPTTEKETLFQELSVLQEKRTTEHEMSVLKKSLALQKTNFKEDSLVKESLAFKNKPSTEEAIMMPLILKEQCMTEGNRSRLKPLVMQEITSGEKSLIMKPLSIKEKPSTEKESFSQEPSALQEKHTTQEEVSILKEPLSLLKSPTEESLFDEALAFTKKCTIEEAPPTKKPLKRKHATQGTMSHLKKPLVLQTTSGEKSLIKEPLPFKEEKVSLKKKCTTQEMVSICPELLDFQDMIGEDKNSFFMAPMSFRKNPTTEETVLTKTSLSLRKKKITQGKMSHLKKPLVLQKTTSEEESFCKKLLPFKMKSTTEEKFLFQEPSALKEKHTTLQEVSLSKESLAIQEKATTEEEFSQELFSLHVKHTNKSGSLFQEALVLKEKTDTEEDSLKKLLALQEKSTMEEESLIKKLLVLKRELSAEAATNIQRQLSLKEQSTAWGKVFLLKKQLALNETINEEQFLNKQPLALEGYPSVEEGETLFKKLLAMQEEPSIEKEAVFKEPTIDTEAHFKEPLALQEESSTEKEAVLKDPTVDTEAHFKETLALQEKPSIEQEALFKQHSALWENPSTEKETIFKESLDLQEKPSIKKETLLKKPLGLKMSTINEAFLFKDMIALNEKPTNGKELSFKEPLALQESPTYKEDTFLKTFLVPQVGTSPNVSSTAPESITGKSSIATMTSVGKSGTTTKSSACESASDKPFSPQAKGTSKEQITPQEDIDEDSSDPSFNPMYAKEIFSYMKEREEQFILTNYMNRQIEITSDMRAILVDWLVEVQVSFEMTHETLYLAVKLVDLYLMKAVCKKDKLQLLGATAFMIAAKFEEHNPPCVDDFVYICDDNYQRYEVLNMEIDILNVLKFDINIPVAYHFLRRYARCIHTNMKTLTLSRYICEMTLQEYSYVQEKASKLAAASLLLALYMKKLGYWVPFLEYYSGYSISELHPLVRQLNKLMTFSSYDSLKAVYYKYSHPVFFEVAKIPALDMLKLEEILNCDCEAEGLVL
ncbi:G2/mitotic-specific cyclin-B3 isoform X1 [Symphalangus syndactylus]|uniref:G2/mitotic-specific cyclin-B3 isoform X1 n=1 Tax=Symphalangus syndactylus TaxID=9590 RepID=UPI0024427F8C|nr:G2/mitotic-specific cyclin-B3 isoform X1 [Symphalangus syndactylus]XP_055124856.1 G2/mitotic-specific cyclin-B3 isoform X1 [Symphalangus syndactylus]XP_055124857.1 G2/mitotic-specific cyclin-B3 isoform X1 [Symphalangus syndactylus]